jgi:hypothetical protein
MDAMKRLALILLTLTLAACSNSWREGDSGRDPTEVAAMLKEIQDAQAQGTANGDVSTALAHADTAVIYFADAPGSLGPVGSILSLSDYSFLGLTSQPTMQQVRVFFLDNGADVSLIIGIDQGQGSFQYYAFTGTATYDGGVMEAQLQGSTGSLIVQSDDVKGSTLNDVIQLSYFNASSGDYIGMNSTLVGYN